MSLANKAIHALKWSVFAEVASRLVGPLVFLILARLLTPQDYGVVAAATVIVSFSQIFSDAGLTKALIQRQDKVDESANLVFWINLGIGLLVIAGLNAYAPEIAAFFHDDRIAPVVRVLSIQILLASFSSVHSGLLQKELQFKRLFWVRLFTTTMPGLLSIPLALNGGGYWALVAGTVFGQFSQSIALWIVSPWRPKFRIELDTARELVSFGKWAMVSGLFGWFYGWADSIVVGHYLGSHDMGMYRTGNTFVMMIFGVIFTPLLPVLYGLFSKAKGDTVKLNNAMAVVMHATALISIPIGFSLFSFKEEVSVLIFGSSWLGIGVVIGVLGLVHATGALVSASGEVFRATGNPHIETMVMGCTLVVYLASYLFSIQFGLLAFLATRLLLVSLSLIPHLAFLRKTIGVSIGGFFRFVSIPLLASIIASVVVYPINNEGGGAIYRIAAFSTFVLIYCSCVVLFDREFLEKMFSIVKSRSVR